ncbi:hypothetical protein D3C87_1765980 [compost metagenome]
MNFVIQPKPASNGEVVSSISLPYKQNPISNLSVSLAAKPIGLISTSLPASKMAFHNFSAYRFSTYISNPPAPVYPVADIIAFVIPANSPI